MEEQARPQVSVLVPALNEADTIREVIDRLLALPLDTQVIVIDDGSTDATPDILASFGEDIVVIRHDAARGKGSSIRSGLALALGEVVVIQDADLEYRPEEIPSLVAPILDGRYNVAYGSRFSNGMHKDMALPNKLVNLMLRWAVRLLFGRKLSDEATCYKAFRLEVLQRMELECERFEFCPEVTAKAMRMNEPIAEVPISYEPRGKEAGKKIRWTDAPEAFWTLLKYRFWKGD